MKDVMAVTVIMLAALFSTASCGGSDDEPKTTSAECKVAQAIVGEYLAQADAAVDVGDAYETHMKMAAGNIMISPDCFDAATVAAAHELWPNFDPEAIDK